MSKIIPSYQGNHSRPNTGSRFETQEYSEDNRETSRIELRCSRGLI